MKVNLEDRIKHLLKSKDILLMSHVVMGYPSFDKNIQFIYLGTLEQQQLLVHQ